LPTVYSARFYAVAGGLVAYGLDFLDQYRRAAGYVDRILKGEKPADLPVQAPTKYDLVLNLKSTCKLPDASKGRCVPDGREQYGVDPPLFGEVYSRSALHTLP
jgi:hypothetical protein